MFRPYKALVLLNVHLRLLGVHEVDRAPFCFCYTQKQKSVRNATQAVAMVVSISAHDMITAISGRSHVIDFLDLALSWL